jgi:hypothetical protein
MNPTIGLLHQRRMRRNERFPLVAINRQLKDFETTVNDEGFEMLVVKKDYFSQEMPSLSIG